MRVLAALVVLAGIAVTSSARLDAGQIAASKRPSRSNSVKPIVMSGCVAGASGSATSRQYLFTDASDGSKYLLTGADVGRYIGQRVEVVGGPETRRLRIAGGLLPSANAAGQAGAQDPAQAAVATSGAVTRGTGTPVLPEFRVTRVGAVGGDCPR